jgi:hypothetical protein
MTIEINGMAHVILARSASHDIISLAIAERRRQYRASQILQISLSAICKMVILRFASPRGIPTEAVRCFPAMFPASTLPAGGAGGERAAPSGSLRPE